MRYILCFFSCFFVILTPSSLDAMRRNAANCENHSAHYFKQIRQLNKFQNIPSRKQLLSQPCPIAAKQIHKLSKLQNSQKESVQMYLVPKLGLKNPVLTVILVAYLLMGQVNAQRFSNSSIIYTKPYQPGQELKTFGPCEPWSTNKNFCCDIQPNYVAECCVHPNRPGYSRCVSFDPVGLLGDSSKTSYNTATKDYLEAEKECDTTYTMAAEATKALLKPTYLQNKNGTSCSIERIEKNDKKGAHFDTAITNSIEGACMTHFSDISYTPLLPIFMRAVKDVAKKLNLKNELHVWAYDDELCSSAFYISPMRATVTIGPWHGLIFPYSFLKQFSNAKQICVVSHELHHENQIKFGEKNMPKQLSNLTGNGIESEADISATLSSNSRCLAVFFRDFSGISRQDFLTALPKFTRANLKKLLDGSASEIHAPYPNRAALVLGIAKNVGLARELLHKKALTCSLLQ